MKHPRILRGVAAAAIAGVMSAPALAEDSVFKAVVHADLKIIDPIWTTAYISRNHGYMVWDTLFATNENFELQPQMAESATVSEDGLTYTIKLRPGLKWHDGSPVTPDDCIASIARWGKKDGMGQQMMAVVESMEAVDDLTFTIKLKETWGLVLAALGKMSSNVPFMMPKRLAEVSAQEQIPESIGSGPYIFVKDEWVPGSKAVYVKNQAYVPRDEAPSAAAGGKHVYVDRFEWHYIPDHQSAMNAIINGEVDYWESVPADLVPVLEAAEGVNPVLADAYGSQGWMRINHLHPPFDNRTARQAIQLVVDQETYLQAIVGRPDLYKVCPAMFMCDTPFATDAGSDRVMMQDFDKAKAMLAEAGYNGETIVLMHPTDLPNLNAATQVTAQLLREAGINLEVQAMDWSTLTSRRALKKAPEEGGWHIFHTSWIAPDLVNPVANIGVSGGGKEKAWFGWPDDPEIEALRQAFARETNPAKQKQLASQVQQRAMDTVTYIPIGQYLQFNALRNNVTGFLPSPVTFFWNLNKS
jgi:peptide/nickel transport system substrate-binding protein